MKQLLKALLLRLEPRLYRDITALARQNRRSRTEEIRIALENHREADRKRAS